MHLHRGAVGVLAALSLGATLLAPATAASDTTAPHTDACMAGSGTSRPDSAQTAYCCVTHTNYSLASKGVRMPFGGVPTFKNGPGGKMIVARSYSGSVSAEVVAGAETEVGAVLARATAHLSASLARTNSTASTNTYERHISRDKYGNARYVSWGQEVAYKKFRINRDCSRTTVATGRIQYPSNSEGWYYWETES
jgi:hypothetical protein